MALLGVLGGTSSWQQFRDNFSPRQQFNTPWDREPSQEQHKASEELLQFYVAGRQGLRQTNTQRVIDMFTDGGPGWSVGQIKPLISQDF